MSEFKESVEQKLIGITDEIKSCVFGQFLAHGLKAKLELKNGIDPATANAHLYAEFESKWSSLSGRLTIVPGKQVLSMLNSKLQESHQITLTTTSIITGMTKDEVTADMQSLIGRLAQW